MRCNPLRWLWGALPIAALAFLASYWERGAIEADLTARVTERLSGTGLSWAKADFEGRDGAIVGRATDENDPLKAISSVSSVWGVRRIENRAALIEKADAYAWWANRNGRRIELHGLAPNDVARQAIVNNARSLFPGSDVVDQMRLARGVPAIEPWSAGVAFGLKQLAGLKAGEVRLDGLGLLVTGEAANQSSFRGVKTALANELPRGVTLRNERVTAPVVSPYVWAARASGAEVILSGYVPNDRMRAEILVAARAAFARGPRVVDRMEIADGAPAGFLAAASASLREIGRLDDGVASLRDATLAVDGLAADEAAAQSAKRGLREPAIPNFRISDQIRAREPVAPAAPQITSPYTGAIEIDGGRVMLTGNVPSAAVQAAIVQSARTRFPGKLIEDRLTIAAGAPESWQRCFDGGLMGLARLGNGRATLLDRRLDVVARTDDDALSTAVPTEVRAAVLGACDANVRVDLIQPTEPDGLWRATLDGNDVVLSGDVPSPQARQALLAQARGQFAANVRVVDNMRVVENRSRNWPRAAETGLASLGELVRGEARLERQQLVVTGEARWDPPLLERVRSRLSRTMPTGYSGREQISMVRPSVAQPPATPPVVTPPQPASPPARVLAPESAACQERLREASRSGIINFERAKANLTADSTQTLDRLAQVARSCPRVRIEVEGHTDAEGTPERNQRLSDRRAATVLQYLVRAGADAASLASVGYGETRPIAPNDTVDNRARNRRIEFTVTE